MNNNLRIWKENVIIPTYKIFEPEKSPLFLEKRAYQGSTGKVYPLPVTEKISDKKTNVEYKAIYLENEYLLIMVLPELGGRIQRALDKTNNYDFIYYNHVIKPALVGLTGPWISGGIEFNWPQHHRPSTYSPVDYKIKTYNDKVSVFLSETDKMYGTKNLTQISLYKDKAYIEINGKFYNGTDYPQTFLWWANPAVPVNDYTYSVFPPDVNAVMDHGKRAVSTFPISTGEYYKYDYSEGVDISRYKNIKVPTSYMAASSEYDFIGNYDENIDAGLLHIANHNIAPGKKQWTWGNGDFGRQWDRNLTDEDGPYIELMTGVFTDNQPDFTWLKPYEEKEFTQYFMPYKSVGRVCNGTKDACLSIEDNILKIYVTSPRNCNIKIWNDKLVYEKNIYLTPKDSYEEKLEFEIYPDKTKIEVLSDNELLVEYKVYKKEIKAIPEPAKELLKPEEIKTTEELFLGGQHLEQYRHATRNAEDYYIEGLKRDDNDIRINNAYGLMLFKQGKFSDSKKHLEKAVKKATWKNPNPSISEYHFNLAIAYEYLEDYDKSYKNFYKATWANDTKTASFMWLSRLECKKGNLKEALRLINNALVYNMHNLKAINLKIAILRKLNESYDDLLIDSLKIDPLYMGILFEEYLLKNNWSNKNLRNDIYDYLNLSLDYIRAGFYDDALSVLNLFKEKNILIEYYKGYIYFKKNDIEQAIIIYNDCEYMNYNYIFPNDNYEIKIFKNAIELIKDASVANYLLGTILYDRKNFDEAIKYFEKSIENRDIPMAYRNLAIGYFNKKDNKSKAYEYMKKAFELDKYSRFLLELDQLSSKINISIDERYKMLSDNINILHERDDLILRYATILNCKGKYKEALNLIENRNFHPWEGGEGKVLLQYKKALLNLGKKSLKNKNNKEAIYYYEKIIYYPASIGEGRLPDKHENQIYFELAKAYSEIDSNKSNEYLIKATQGNLKPEIVLYYNDEPSDYIYYIGLAYKELGNEDMAKRAFNQLIFFGESHYFDKMEYDYFAVSLPELEVFKEDLNKNNKLYCKYLIALGYKGLGDINKYNKLCEEIIEIQEDYFLGV